MIRSVGISLVSLLLCAVVVACGGVPPGGTTGPTPPPDPGGPLAALLPTTLAGQPVVVAEATGEQAAPLFPSGSGTALADEMAKVRRDIGDFEVAAGIHPSATVGVFRIGGLHWTPGSSQMARLVTTMLGPVSRMHVSSPTIAGKRVYRIIDRDNDAFVAYAYISGHLDGDNVFFATGDQAVIEEFFGGIR